MSLRAQAATLTLVTFSVTLAILFWSARDRHPHEPLIAQPPMLRAAAFPAPSAPAPVLERSRPVGAGPSVAAIHPALAQNDESKAQSFAQVPVPAWVVLGPATDQSGRTLTLRNSSARPLDVSVTVSNPQTGHQASAQVNLPPFADVPIEAAQLLVQKGDVLTLHGPPFGDREVDTSAENAF
jgi:hypothetical protein